MKNNYILNISIKHLFKKENILYGIITTILITIIFVLLTIVNFVLNYVSDTMKYNVLYRTILVNVNDESKEKLDSISNINHVAGNYNSKYYYGYSSLIPEFNKNNNNAVISLFAILEENEIKIIDGKMPTNDNEIVVPVNFYPYSDYNYNSDIKDKMIKGTDLIGKNLELYSEKGKPIISSNTENYSQIMEEWQKNRIKYSYVIVGTYDSVLAMSERNQCYTTISGLDKLNPIGVVSFNSQNDTETMRIIRVDNYKNISYVKNELNKQDFSFSNAFEFDYNDIKMTFLIPLIISTILILQIIILIYNFVSKKFKKRYKKIGILKVLGYQNKMIEKIELLENIIVFMISTFISILIYLAILFIITNNFLGELDYYSVKIKIPFIFMSVIILLLLIYTYLINHFISKNISKFNISELIKND